MRRGRLAVLLAAAVLLLAGCADIPTTGTVQNGATEAPNGTPIVYVPNPPAPGATARDIVAGFLTAASGGGTFAVAKEYLTSGFAKKWNPSTRVLVQAQQTAQTTQTGSDIHVEMPVSAHLNEDGIYSTTSSTEPLSFHLVQVGGQWRIDQAEDGIVLSPTVFQKNYAPLTLQFFDPTWTHLVPDRRWFPTTLRRGTSGPDPRAIVSALIKGPAGPLAGGVTANALKGTTIAAVDASSSDVTTVALNARGSTPDATTTARMQQQLIQPLGLPTASALRLVVNSSVAPQVKELAEQLTPQAYAVSGGKFGTVSPSGALTEERTLGPRIVATRPRAITVSLRQKMAAVLTGTGDVAIVTPSGTRPVDSRPGTLLSTLDQRGWVYSVPSDSPSGLQAANGDRTVLLGSDLGGATVSSIQVSPDGTRLLVLVGSPSGPRAYVAGIERETDGTPVGLTGSEYKVDLSGIAGTGIGATWIDDSRVAVLISGSDNDRIQSQQLGGLSVPLGQFANVTSLVGTSSLDDLRIRVSTGDLYVWNDPNWQQESDTAVDVSVLAVQR